MRKPRSNLQFCGEHFFIFLGLSVAHPKPRNNIYITGLLGGFD